MTLVHEQTALGTVVRDDWSKDHLRLVMIEERKRKRAICGAKNHKGLPCSRIPEQEFGFYCSTHKDTGRTKAEIVGVGPKSLATPDITTLMMAKEELREHFFRCQVCVSRTTCQYFSKDRHCVVEENIFDNFIREAKQHDEILDIDLPMLYNAALSFIRSMRANRVLAKITLIDAEDTRLSWMAARESKEYRDAMKSLGLSRKERLDRRKDEAGIGNVSSGLTLSQVMSMVQENLPEGTKLKLRHEFEIEKKKIDKRARSLERDNDGFLDNEPISSTDDSDDEE